MALSPAQKLAAMAPAPRRNRGTLSRGNVMATCRGCGKLTHSSVDGNSGIALCRPCLDAAGMENEHADGHHADAPHYACPSCA